MIECDKDIGEIQLVTVGNGEDYLPNVWATWYVEYTSVKNFQNNKDATFPCYHWIALGDYFTNAASCSELILFIFQFIVLSPENANIYYNYIHIGDSASI